MDVRELGKAGSTDLAKLLSCCQQIPRLNGYTPLPQMAVLRFQAVAVIEHDPVAAFAVRQRCPIGLALDELVFHSVTRTPHPPCRRCDHRNRA